MVYVSIEQFLWKRSKIKDVTFMETDVHSGPPRSQTLCAFVSPGGMLKSYDFNPIAPYIMSYSTKWLIH